LKEQVRVTRISAESAGTGTGRESRCIDARYRYQSDNISRLGGANVCGCGDRSAPTADGLLHISYSFGEASTNIFDHFAGNSMENGNSVYSCGVGVVLPMATAKPEST